MLPERKLEDFKKAQIFGGMGVCPHCHQEFRLPFWRRAEGIILSIIIIAFIVWILYKLEGVIGL